MLRSSGDAEELSSHPVEVRGRKGELLGKEALHQCQADSLLKEKDAKPAGSSATVFLPAPENPLSCRCHWNASGWGPRFCISSQLSGDVGAAWSCMLSSKALGNFNFEWVVTGFCRKWWPGDRISL